MVPSLLEILIAEEPDGSPESAELVGAQQTLTFLCDPCVQPIFSHIISMDEPNAEPFPEEPTFASACGSPACLNRYRELAQTHAAGSAGKTMVLFNDIKLTCSNSRHPDKALATQQVYELMQAIDGSAVARAAGRLRSEKGALRAASRQRSELAPASVGVLAHAAGAAGELGSGAWRAQAAVAALLVVSIAAASVVAAVRRG